MAAFDWLSAHAWTLVAIAVLAAVAFFALIALVCLVGLVSIACEARGEDDDGDFDPDDDDGLYGGEPFGDVPPAMPAVPLRADRPYPGAALRAGASVARVHDLRARDVRVVRRARVIGVDQITRAERMRAHRNRARAA